MHFFTLDSQNHRRYTQTKLNYNQERFSRRKALAYLLHYVYPEIRKSSDIERPENTRLPSHPELNNADDCGKITLMHFPDSHSKQYSAQTHFTLRDHDDDDDDDTDDSK